MLVGGKVLIELGGAPLVPDSRRELVAEDVVGVVPFGGGGVAVGGDVLEQHPIPVKVFNGVHVAVDLGEEDGNRLVVAILDRADAVIKSRSCTGCEEGTMLLLQSTLRQEESS